MRVVMVSHSAVPGGMNTVVESLVRHRPPGVEVAWVFLEAGDAVARATVPWAVIEAGRARRAWRAAGTVRALRSAIRSFGADLVFGHVTKAHLYAAPAARLEGVPYLWWQHERFGQRPLMHSIAGRIRAGAVICCTDALAEAQRRRFPHTPVVRVHGGVEVDAAGPPRGHRASEAVVFGVVGRLQRWKRVELAIQAMPTVLHALPRATLRIVGDTAPGLDDEYPAELRARARALGVEHAVELTGHLPDGARAAAELDVLVHCAELEPFGLAPLEAMLGGVPVIVPDEGGPRETVRQGVDGLRVDPRDTAALAAAMVELGRDPARRSAMGAAGRERVKTSFGAHRMAAEAWSVARAVAARRDPSRHTGSA